MGYLLNTTDDYYLNDKDSLSWELTVCNALYPDQSPCRIALQNSGSFGTQLFRYLDKLLVLKEFKNILEIGGGFGYLMRDILSLAPWLQATMLDISPFLIKKQKETLTGYNVQFLNQDAMTLKADDFSSYDFVVMNENMGDFPTLVAQSGPSDDPDCPMHYHLKKVRYFAEKYQITFSVNEHINIGALEILENICLAGVRHVYLSEHSCEAEPPVSVKPFLHFESASMPERIALKKHDEYTIKFSHLQKLAQAHGYRVVRGQFVDFLPLNCSDKVRTALRLTTPFSDEQEIIQQFVYDLFKYEYMVLIK